MPPSPTDAKAAELLKLLDALDQAAAAGAKTFDEAFNAPPFGFSAHEINLDKTFTRVSPGHRALLGYAPPEMVGHGVVEFVILKETSERAISRKLAPGAVLLPFNRTWRTKDGGQVTLLMQDRHLKDVDGHVIGIRTAITQAP